MGENLDIISGLPPVIRMFQQSAVRRLEIRSQPCVLASGNLYLACPFCLSHMSDISTRWVSFSWLGHMMCLVRCVIYRGNLPGALSLIGERSHTNVVPGRLDFGLRYVRGRPRIARFCTI